MLPSTTTGITSAGSSWADLGLHASLVSHIAVADKLPMDLPIAAGTALTYPLIVDFLSAILVHSGWSLHLALFIPGLLLALSFTQLALSLSLRLFGSLTAALIGLGLALTNASAAGFDAAWSDFRASGLSLTAFLSHIPRNYSGLDQINAHFNNLIADIILPQRAFLFGLAIFCIVLSLTHIYARQPRRQLLVAIAGLTG